MCENSFLCYTQVYFGGVLFEGIHWFFAMLVFAFFLQIIANFLWLKNSQISREILQLPTQSTRRSNLINWSAFWTAMSTLVWILRIVLVIGNNIWIFITILLGNITGTFWASSIQKQDLNHIETLFKSMDDTALRKLQHRLIDLEKKNKGPLSFK